jgi:predicted deacylase
MEKRIETILSLELPYREKLILKRSVYHGGEGPSVALIAGIHGDEPEGLYLCHRLAAWLEELDRVCPHALLGQVELYPCLNPLGLATLRRTVPVFDSDLNRSFPGCTDGLLPQRIAAAVLNYLQSARLVIAIQASNAYLSEIPQIHLAQGFADKLLPLAKHSNVAVIWIQGESFAPLQATLAYSLNQHGTPCLTIAMSSGTDLLTSFTEQLIIGVLNLWRDLGVLATDLDLPKPSHSPLIVDDDKVCHLYAQTSGIFSTTLSDGTSLVAGQSVGRLVSPFEGNSLVEIYSPVMGKLISLRQYPLIYEGSLLARIVKMPTLEEVL